MYLLTQRHGLQGIHALHLMKDGHGNQYRLCQVLNVQTLNNHMHLHMLHVHQLGRRSYLLIVQQLLPQVLQAKMLVQEHHQPHEQVEL